MRTSATSGSGIFGTGDLHSRVVPLNAALLRADRRLLGESDQGGTSREIKNEAVFIYKSFAFLYLAEREGFGLFQVTFGLQVLDSPLPTLPFLLLFPERITQNCPNAIGASVLEP